MDIGNFNYHNKEIVKSGGKKTVRIVHIKNGKGHKSISYWQNGKHKKTVKRRVKPQHVKMIKRCKFIPGLFSDCQKHSTYNKV